MKKVALIFHGKLKGKEAIIQELQALVNGSVEMFTSTEAGQTVMLAYKAAKEGFNHIVCVGGDGSLNEMVNGIMQAKPEMPEDLWSAIRVGVLPMGTGNDFVKTIGITSNIKQLAGFIASEEYRLIDIGLVDFQSISGGTGQRYFVNITDVGMGGMAAEKLNSLSKWMGSFLTYQRAIITTLLSYKNKPVKATADGFSYTGSTKNLIVANGKFFGSGLGVAPNANPFDGKFDIVIIGEVSLWDYFHNLGKIRKCVTIDHPAVEYKSATEIQIDSPAEPLSIDMDGEFIGYSPMLVRVVPAAIKFMCA